MILSHILTDDVIEVNLRTRNKLEVFAGLIKILENEGRITDFDKILAAVVEREDKMNTAISPGVAIPHARTQLVKKLAGALGISKKGLDYGTNDGRPVHLIFLLVSPLQNASEHIAVMAQIARLVESPEFYQKLVSASSPSKVLEVIRTFEERIKR